MRPIFGPFLPDPNINVALVAFDDLVWIVNRRALHDSAEKGEWGVVELVDVRAHRRRSLDDATLAALPEDLGWWAAQLDESDYLREVTAGDLAGSAAGARHAHFLVKDGWHRVIDVIARGISCRVIRDSSRWDLVALMRSGSVEEFLRP